jgi:hypothetical protein
MLWFLAEESRGRGMAALRGWFLPAAKNAPPADLYRKHGFEGGAAAARAWRCGGSRPSGNRRREAESISTVSAGW